MGVSKYGVVNNKSGSVEGDKYCCHIPVLEDFSRESIISRYYSGVVGNASIDKLDGKKALMMNTHQDIPVRIYRSNIADMYRVNKGKGFRCEIKYTDDVLEQVLLGIHDEGSDQHIWAGVRPSEGDYIVMNSKGDHVGGSYTPVLNKHRMKLHLNWTSDTKADITITSEKLDGSKRGSHTATGLKFNPQDPRLAFGVKSSSSSKSGKCYFTEPEIIEFLKNSMSIEGL